ncbi:MAG: hypothetical protein JNL34_08885 [Anaerolineae bacterium]|nr:hypothetical protein [Anaerolineae bacterium]
MRTFRPLLRSALEVLAIILAAACLNALRPAPARASFGPPQQVITTDPQTCVHTRLTDEVEEWKVQRSLQEARELGAPTIVEFFPWAYIESAEDRYDWAAADRIVRHAENQGIRIIARMGLVPDWARDSDRLETSTLNTLPEESYADFAAFVADFAARYAAVIDQIIIWNEPNLAFEWGFSEVDPAGYARLLEAVYQAAHAANPNVEILAAPLAPTLEPEGSPAGLNDLLYLQALYDAGAAPYFDALAVHTYGFTSPPDDPPAPDKLNFRRAELLREIMIENGDAGKPVYVTETGWNDSPRWAYGVLPSQRASWTVRALQIAAEDWPWAETLCLWVLRYPAPSYSYPDDFALLTTGFQRKPVFDAVRAYTQGEAVPEERWLPPPAAPSS